MECVGVVVVPSLKISPVLELICGTGDNEDLREDSERVRVKGPDCGND
jgi:hypothetical protein